MMYESGEMIIPEETGYAESTPQEYDVVDGKNLAGPLDDSAESNVKGYVNPQNLNDGSIMVKELTLEDFDGTNFTVTGSSNDTNILQNKWLPFHNLRTGSGSEGSAEGNVNREILSGNGSLWEEPGYSSLSDFLTQKPCNDEVAAQLTNTDSKVGSDTTLAPGGIRTKILSKSGFSQFFVKNTLKGKGVICRSATPSPVGSELPYQINTKSYDKSKIVSDNSVGSSAKRIPAKPTAAGHKPEVLSRHVSCSGLTLRDWMKTRRHSVKATERLYIFRQIVDIVNQSHSRGDPILYLYPSSFIVSSSNQINYIGVVTGRDWNVESNDRTFANIGSHLSRKRDFDSDEFAPASSHVKKGKYIRDSAVSGCWFPQSSRSSLRQKSSCAFDISSHEPLDPAFGSDNDIPVVNSQDKSGTSQEPGKASLQLSLQCDQLEEKWYTSPEEGISSLASNIYSLGVLLFELLCSFDSDKAHANAMSDLRYRILPPKFLAEYPNEVGFCLWLLHPEPLSRPTIREVLKCKFISELPNVYGEELSSSIESETTESELLSHFLVIAKDQKDKYSLKLAEDLHMLEADIEEIERRQLSRILKPDSCLNRGSLATRKFNLTQLKYSGSYLAPQSHSEPSLVNDLRLIKNSHQLESAYFSMRNNIKFSESNSTARSVPDLINQRGAQYGLHTDGKAQDETDRMGAFFEGLCKFARYSKFEVRGVSRSPEFNSASVIFSLSFDRDQDYFAAAGVSKKIKIFDYHSFFNLSVDIHYPVSEMANQSRLSCICWNPYIKNYLASADYDGAVKLWDAATGVDFSEYTEHRKRAWSVDFSQSDPTKLASGSDDYSVKLWSITQKKCLGTIKSHANICCVQFSPHSSNLFAFGSADYKAYCYDLRYPRSPWCTLAGHGKAVSNLKFVDSKTLVSASTDNSLKLWDLSKTTHDGQSVNACTLTFSGHTNDKNFVGLSVEDGFIACGSETNEVFTYYRSLPMPITTHKFGSVDPISGKETIEDNGHFVSSVCWRKNSDALIAANSTGCIKVLQLV
uniref:Uncharacterized protein n=1 Tax=Kalanchoe fedtschenkoi TaxID=63787 RepID=A0A7N0TQJ0_KALFE